MATTQRLCDICETRGITVLTTDWCPECEQSLCESCKAHHSAAKLSKTHQTIPVESFDKLPVAVKEITNDCSAHGARFEYYCSHHELACCVECLKTTHSECRRFNPMHTVVEHYKTSNALSDFDQTLSDLLINLNTLTKDRLTNIFLLSDQKNECLKGIKEAKQKIIAHLDELEMKLKVEIETLQRKHVKSIEGTIKEIEELKTNVEKMQDEAEVIKQYASDFQTFTAFRDFESKAKGLETDTQSLMNDSVKTITLSYSLGVQSVENLNLTLGYVNVFAKESDIKLVNYRGKQAQLLAIGTPCINKIKLKPVLENVQVEPSGKDDKLTIWDSCFLSHGRLAFSDQLNKRLILLKDNGDHDRDINLTFMPGSIAYVTDNETAVGKYKSNEINIINMTSSTVDRSFAVKGYDSCVFSFRKGQFLVSGTRVGFCITDIEGNILSEIPFSDDSVILFAVLLNDKIYCSQYSKGRIVCYDLKGNEVYEFKNKKLKAPLGVSCTDTNVLFITGYQSKNICALANTGNDFKELYCNTNLSGARAISYDSSKQQLLATTQGGNIFLFDGNVSNEYRDERLKHTVGVTCSDTGVFFITGFSSHNILTLSINGNEMKELYSSSNLHRARSISYNSSKQQLLVSTEDGKISLFDIKY